MVQTAGSLDCGICGQVVANKRILDHHIKNLHKKLKPFLCSICGYRTAVKHSLMVHMRKHTGKFKLYCLVFF